MVLQERHLNSKKKMAIVVQQPQLRQRQLLRWLRGRLRRKCSRELKWRELRRTRRRLRRRGSKSRWRRRKGPILRKRDSNKKI
jgi:hypothetical protein